MKMPSGWGMVINNFSGSNNNNNLIIKTGSGQAINLSQRPDALVLNGFSFAQHMSQFNIVVCHMGAGVLAHCLKNRVCIVANPHFYD